MGKHKKSIEIIFFAAGLLISLASCLAYFVLGSKCYIQMNDQLDGEVLNYIYRAKYLFSGDGTIPEFMNGMGRSAMTPPSPMGVLFYRILPPFAAFAAMHIFVAAVGYAGMFLLVRQVLGVQMADKRTLDAQSSDRRTLGRQALDKRTLDAQSSDRQAADAGLASLGIALVVSCIFVYLPFYPVYGLSILGQPLLAWALIRICQTDGRRLRYYLCVLLYGAGSSFALVGFAWVFLLFLAWAAGGLADRLKGRRQESVRGADAGTGWQAGGLKGRRQEPVRGADVGTGGLAGRLKGRHQKSVQGGLGRALLLLAGSYAVCNLDLAKEMLGIGHTYTPHREEMIIAAISDWKGYFWELFLEGGSYGKSYNMAIALLAAVILAGYPLLCRLQKRRPGASYKLMAALLGAAAVISGGAVLWRIGPVVELRMQIGGAVKYFQADRIYWLLPLCWYLILALCLWMLLAEGRKLWALRYAAALGAAAFLCFAVYQNSTIYHNLRLMIFPDTYHLMNWDDYYAEDVFGQIDDFLGKDKASYRTVSLGITPAAALYNGFYCLDGYSNLYSLEYKHEFREIIEKELDKLEGVRVYFDAWGNRCYLFNAETGNYMMIAGDNGGAFQHLELNTGKMYEMGARYLFAAMPIENAGEMGLVLAREEPFATQDSYYRIWLYEVAPEK